MYSLQACTSVDGRRRTVRLNCVTNGCKSFIDVSDPVADNVAFLCRLCAPVAPDEVRFQDYQFDNEHFPATGDDPGEHEFGPDWYDILENMKDNLE